SFVDPAGNYVRGAPGGAVVGVLVSGGGTRRRWIHRATDFQRERRKKRIVIGAVVQPGALRTAALALDFDGARGGRSLSGVGAAWKIVLGLGAGTGGVYLLRWYWWRVNAWSEISAMMAALVTTLALHSNWLWTAIAGRGQPFSGSDPVVFAKTTLCTTGVTTLVWIGGTLLTPAEPGDTLVKFYRKVRPQITGWQPVAKLAGD